MKSRRRTSVSNYLSDVVDATEDFVDDVLDRADDVECDLRRSISDALDCRYDFLRPLRAGGGSGAALAHGLLGVLGIRHRRRAL